LVSQGVVSFGIFAFIFYQIYSHSKALHKSKKKHGAFLPVVIFLLFVMQVDTFLYIDGLGFVIFSLLTAEVAIRVKEEVKQVMPVRKRMERIKLVESPYELTLT
jgi:hypothetical protein